MSDFDYSREAELFPTRTRRGGRSGFAYRRFARASDAIRFAIEDLPSGLLVGAHLQVEEERYDAAGIRSLYESEAFPLVRRRPAAPEA
jgi:hypothetical protein